MPKKIEKKSKRSSKENPLDSSFTNEDSKEEEGRQDEDSQGEMNGIKAKSINTQLGLGRLSSNDPFF